MHQHFGLFERSCDENPTTEHAEGIPQSKKRSRTYCRIAGYTKCTCEHVLHILTVLCYLIHLFIQPNFQPCLSVEESSQEASKSSYKYLTWYYFLTCTDAKRDVWEDSEPNKDDMSIERRNVGEGPMTTGGGMYKLTH